MGILILAALFLFQGIPAATSQGGTVSGVLRGADGKPAAHVRVAAVTLPETITDRTSASMSSLAETDDQGRYVLEGIPQGRYLIAAGRVDYPTYHPGTLNITRATIISVMPGTSVTGITFSVTDASDRPPDFSDISRSPLKIAIPLQVRMERGGKVPVFSGGKFVMLRFTSPPPQANLSGSIGSGIIEVQSGYNYDVRIEDLPDGYTLNALTYGSTDLRSARLPLPAIYPGASTIPTPPIQVVLRYAPPARSGLGVRVSGNAKDKTPRSIYLSGTPGTYYADGTFEFFNVPPGKHTLAGLDTPMPLGALVVVGDRDIDNVELKTDATPLPFNLRQPRAPAPAGDAAPGSVLPLASARGVVVETESGKPIPETTVKITGYAKTEIFKTDPDGKFEIPGLFAGEYTLDIDIFGHERISETLLVGTETIALDLRTRRLY